MADLIFPIIVIIIMFLIIDSLTSGFLLLCLGLLFVPISWIFMYAVGDYTQLFDVSITPYTSNIAYKSTISLIMFMVPIFSFTKIWYMKYMLAKGDIPKTMVSEGGNAD